ncbi:MAG TPA: hypothetical protein PKG80_07690, partial [Acidobacteriota bacterium]|nr:hypothetical protein [Acidobacteriota bacterium]
WSTFVLLAQPTAKNVKPAAAAAPSPALNNLREVIERLLRRGSRGAPFSRPFSLQRRRPRGPRSFIHPRRGAPGDALRRRWDRRVSSIAAAARQAPCDDLVRQ